MNVPIEHQTETGLEMYFPRRINTIKFRGEYGTLSQNKINITLKEISKMLYAVHELAFSRVDDIWINTANLWMVDVFDYHYQLHFSDGEKVDIVKSPELFRYGGLTKINKTSWISLGKMFFANSVNSDVFISRERNLKYRGSWEKEDIWDFLQLLGFQEDGNSLLNIENSTLIENKGEVSSVQWSKRKHLLVNKITADFYKISDKVSINLKKIQKIEQDKNKYTIYHQCGTTLFNGDIRKLLNSIEVLQS